MLRLVSKPSYYTLLRPSLIKHFSPSLSSQCHNRNTLHLPGGRRNSSDPHAKGICRHRSLSQASPRHFSSLPDKQKEKRGGDIRELVRENIYTVPNALTMSRILSCPFLAWSILDGDFSLAAGILAYAGISDWVDGFLARRYQMRSVLGTVLDPAADKTLMTTLTVTLAIKDLIPVPLACIILSRDVLLSLAAFYIRYKTLPSPKTLHRYWDFSIPSAEVHPTGISKINTALQLFLMGVTTISPLMTVDLGLVLQSLHRRHNHLEWTFLRLFYFCCAGHNFKFVEEKTVDIIDVLL